MGHLRLEHGQGSNNELHDGNGQRRAFVPKGDGAMTLPFSLFLALKYLRPKRTFLSAVTVLSVMGVLLGVAVLVIVLSVMTGFDEMWREKILDFNAHVTVTGRGSLEGREDELCEYLEGLEGVAGAAPFLQSLAFVRRIDGSLETPLLRGIDPEREGRVGTLAA